MVVVGVEVIGDPAVLAFIRVNSGRIFSFIVSLVGIRLTGSIHFQVSLCFFKRPKC